jgi:CRISPR type III-A-associated protein Csm2
MAYKPPSNQTHGRQDGRRGQPHGGDSDPDLERLLKPDRTVDYFEAESSAGQRRTIRAGLLDDEAQAEAKAILELPASQLRRFYVSVISLKRELEINPAGNSDALVRARLALLKAHAAYAKKRMEDMPDAFIKFIVRHVASVKTKDDFVYGFAPCFEAVVAYHKLFESKKRGK